MESSATNNDLISRLLRISLTPPTFALQHCDRVLDFGLGPVDKLPLARAGGPAVASRLPGSACVIRERTGEGRKTAMAAGIRFGRKRKLSDYQRTEAIKRRAAGETLASTAKSYGVHLTMISRL